MLSVLLTAYNEGAEVLRTVRSIARNTRGEFEIIVVDDGSTDACCQGLDDFGVAVIRHERRLGVGAVIAEEDPVGPRRGTGRCRAGRYGTDRRGTGRCGAGRP